MNKDLSIKVLKNVLDYLNMNPKQLSDSLGKERPQWAYDVLNPNKKVGVSKNIAELIVSVYPEINLSWLLTGEGDMIKGATKELKKEAVILNPNAVIYVPLVNQYAYAGYLNGYQDETYMNTLPTIPFIADHEARGNYIAFEVKGDSMNDGTEESYLEGDRLLCREIPPYLWKDSKLHIKKWDFVIVHEEGIIVKRITEHDVENHTITVHSLNELYPDRTINLEEVKQIFNVVEMQRPRRR